MWADGLFLYVAFNLCNVIKNIIWIRFESESGLFSKL